MASWRGIDERPGNDVFVFVFGTEPSSLRRVSVTTLPPPISMAWIHLKQISSMAHAGIAMCPWPRSALGTSRMMQFTAAASRGNPATPRLSLRVPIGSRIQ